MFKKFLGLLSDAAVYGASSVLSQLIGFLLLPLYTKSLTPADYGVMAMLAIITTVFIPVANLGMTNAVFRRFNLEKDAEGRGRVLATGLWSLVASAVALFAVGQLAAPLVAEALIGDPAQVGLVRLTLAGALVASIATVPTVTLRADRRVKTLAAVNVTKVLVAEGLTIYLVVEAGAGVAGVIVATLVSDALAGVVQFTLTRRYLRHRPSLAAWRTMLAYGLPLVPQNLQAIGVALFGQYVLRKMVGIEETGLFDLASKFAAPLTFVVNAIQNAWVPYKFELHANEADARPVFRSIVTYYFAVVSYLWLGMSVWGPELCRGMTAERFHAAAALIPLVALVRVAQGAYYMLGTGIELSEDTRPYPLVGFGGLVTVVGLSYALVPRLSYTGAVAASVAGWAVMTVLVLGLARRRFRVPYDWAALAALAAAAGLVVAVARAADALPTAARLAVALLASLLYPAVVALVLLRSPAERERVRGLITRFKDRKYRKKGPAREPASA